MSLRQTTREIIAHVEQASGIPVHVMQNVNLPTLASVQMARGNMPAHGEHRMKRMELEAWERMNEQ